MGIPIAVARQLEIAMATNAAGYALPLILVHQQMPERVYQSSFTKALITQLIERALVAMTGKGMRHREAPQAAHFVMVRG